ncbi:MAG: T9SS type A sorting domain-containing protein [Candidatus Latescibacteria bacterium]|nr:T9SS type A sorting domain-containing protein [Candidatus Latescibacterota bacterium]
MAIPDAPTLDFEAGDDFSLTAWVRIDENGRSDMTLLDKRLVPTGGGAFGLDDSYPNPFNPSNTIAFALPQATAVTLTVYNLQGQKVQTLVDAQPYAAGRHTVAFDGSELAAGVYFYRIEAGIHRAVKKMTLLK